MELTDIATSSLLREVGLRLALHWQALGTAEDLGKYMGLFVKKFAFWVSEMAHQGKMLAAKPENPSSTPLQPA